MPRPPPRVALGLAVLVVAIVTLSLTLSRTSAPETEAGPAMVDKVVVFAIPGLGIDDLDRGLMGNLDLLSQQGSIAVANVRIRNDAPDLAGAYGTFGAGNRTRAVEGDVLAYPSDADAGGFTVGEAVAAKTGQPVPGELVIPSMDTVAAGIGPDGGSQPGALASALAASGRRSAVVTNASAAVGVGSSGQRAPAALAVASPVGSVDTGSVADDLLETSVTTDGTPIVQADPERFVDAVRDVSSDADVVIVDPGDTTRALDAIAAAENAEPVEPEVDEGAPAAEPPPDQLRTEALARTDAILGQVERSLDDDTLLMVVGITPPGESWALTPVVVAGPQVPAGYLSSPSTNRPALVTLTDLAPTVLDTLGGEVPAEMIGTPLRYRPADASWDQARRLDDLLESQASVSRSMTVTFIVVQSIVYGVAFLLLVGRGIPRRWRTPLEVGALACGAWPVATFLLRAGTSLYSLGPGTFALSWLIAVALALAAQRLRTHPLDPLIAVAGLTVGVLVLDVSTGSHLQLGSFFGYPPQTAPRFIGLGNSAFALLGGATTVLMGALVARSEAVGGDRATAWWSAATAGILVAFAVGAPWAGADVGGTLTVVPVVALFLWVLSGRTVRWPAVLGAVGLGGVVLAAGVGIEALRPADQRTHIGRFFLNAGDSSSVADTLLRKWDTNTAAIGQTPATLLVPVIVVFAVLALGRLPSIKAVVAPGSAVRSGVFATLAIGTIGWLLNDSGLIVLALACVFLGPLLTVLVVRHPLSAMRRGPVRPMPRSVPTEPVAPGDGTPVVVALVPAKDRADSIAETVQALLRLDLVQRVLVIDDGSTDSTTQCARDGGAEVLRLKRNRGKGAAVLAGAAATPEADIYLLIDADLARTASAAGALLAPVIEERAELAIGVLPPAGGKGGFGTIKRLSAQGVQRACGFLGAAPLSGQRAVRGHLLRGLRSAERFGLEVAMTIDVVRSGGRVIEVDVPMDHRHTGRGVAGFAHRGAQGVDILRALWPRLTSRRTRIGLLAGGVLVWTFAGFISASAAVPDATEASRDAERVVIITIPDLGLGDVDRETMPNLYALSEQRAFGLLTPRTRGGGLPEAALATLGAGDRARAGGLDTTLDLEGRPVPIDADGASFTLPVMAELVADPPENVSALPGSLGDALHAAGRSTALVSGATITPDPAFPGSTLASAPAALAIADQTGSVDQAYIGGDLLVPDGTGPSRTVIDPVAVRSAVDRALVDADVVIVDPGETDRVVQARSVIDSGAAQNLRTAALRRTDAVIGRLAEERAAGTRLIVTGLSPGPEDHLTPIVVAGAGIERNRVTSPSTRRPDLVALTDVAPTVLDSLGIEVPDAMIGQAIQYQSGSPDRADLQRQDDLIEQREDGYGTALNMFIWAVAALYLVAAIVLLVPGTGAWPRSLLRFAALTTTAWPLATFVVRAIGPLYGQGLRTQVALWVIAGGIALLARRCRTHPLDSLLFIGGATVALISIDLATGARLQTSSFLGYTPSVAARFVGLGNAGFGAFAAAGVVVATAWVARASRPSDAWWGAAALAVVLVITDGAPWLGSDVGGILTLVPGLGLLLLLLAGRRATWRSLVALGGTTLLILGGAVAIEAIRPADQRTHIGQFFLGSDQSGFRATIDRKWEVNIRLLTESNWTWIIVVILIFLVLGRSWLHLTRAGSPERAGLAGLATVALLGWVTNDSGPIVAALVLVVLGAYVICLAAAPPGSSTREDAVLLAPTRAPEPMPVP